VGTGDPYPCGYEYGVNSYQLVDISDPIALFFRHRYRYMIVIHSSYLSIAISSANPQDRPLGRDCLSASDLDQVEQIHLRVIVCPR
jgi:hypothetical protein